MRKRGKKIDVLTIKEGAQIHKVELRFDRETGDFIAELGSVEFTSKKLEETARALDSMAAQPLALAAPQGAQPEEVKTPTPRGRRRRA